MDNAILLISCPDRKGIIAKVTNFIYENAGNIEHADQHIDSQTNTFFMRIEWALKDFKIDKDNIAKSFSHIAEEFSMEWKLYFTDKIQRVAIFVSKRLHCLYDLLLRHRAKQFNCEIPLIVSNHLVAKEIADSFNIRYFYFPVTKETKIEQEIKQISLMRDEGIDLIVLARYTQILSPQFVNVFPNRIINIHHSFLPAFVGSKPYHQAYRKGVKIIGATSHYATEELDAGPIIEQDIVRISHR
ncbi:MAG: formyltetrahydrofolate deformylase, partial [Candidatus Omnitrophica bacterium]|nr:formyltetrahydrofolate deformylase [Candidatus Omnitrophota bacterium]